MSDRLQMDIEFDRSMLSDADKQLDYDVAFLRQFLRQAGGEAHAAFAAGVALRFFGKTQKGVIGEADRDRLLVLLAKAEACALVDWPAWIPRANIVDGCRAVSWTITTWAIPEEQRRPEDLHDRQDRIEAIKIVHDFAHIVDLSEHREAYRIFRRGPAMFYWVAPARGPAKRAA